MFNKYTTFWYLYESQSLIKYIIIIDLIFQKNYHLFINSIEKFGAELVSTVKKNYRPSRVRRPVNSLQKNNCYSKIIYFSKNISIRLNF